MASQPYPGTPEDTEWFWISWICTGLDRLFPIFNLCGCLSSGLAWFRPDHDSVSCWIKGSWWRYLEIHQCWRSPCLESLSLDYPTTITSHPISCDTPSNFQCGSELRSCGSNDLRRSWVFFRCSCQIHLRLFFFKVKYCTRSCCCSLHGFDGPVHHLSISLFWITEKKWLTLIFRWTGKEWRSTYAWVFFSSSFWHPCT